MNNNLDIYGEMLFESAKAIFEVVKNPSSTEETKILIASVNALTTATKTAIQNELLQYKLGGTTNTTLQVLGKVDE